MNRILNRDLLPTSGIRAGLSTITSAAFLPFCLPVHCETAPSVCQSSRMQCMRYSICLSLFSACMQYLTLILSYPFAAFSSWWNSDLFFVLRPLLSSSISEWALVIECYIEDCILHNIMCAANPNAAISLRLSALKTAAGDYLVEETAAWCWE